MKIRKQNQGSTGPEDTGRGPISAANYSARFQAFAAGRGWFMIRNPDGGASRHWAETADTPAQWRAWMAWLARRAIPSVFARSHGVVAVPSEWPEQFDPECPASDRTWFAPAPRRIISPVERERVNARFRKLQHRVGFPSDRRGVSNFAADADRLAALAEIESRAAYWKSPLASERDPSAEAAPEF